MLGAGRTWTLATSLPPCPACCPGEQHAIVNEAEDLNLAARDLAVDDQVPRLRNPEFRFDQTPRRAKVIGSKAADPGKFPRADLSRAVTDRGHRREDKSKIPFGGVDTPTPSALKQYCVDPFGCAPDEPVAHYVMSAANRSRRRAIVRSCSASTSPGDEMEM